MVWADARFLCKEETSLDDNRAMRAESGVGTLPNGCCAPLAFPYVPVQKNDPERYSQQDALKAGTLFPGLNLPFHAQMKTKFPAVNTALSELMALDFAIDELGLYLTTHPEDTEVLNLYWSYIKLGREGREAYEKQYGPILQTDVTPDSFKWLNDPGRGIWREKSKCLSMKKSYSIRSRSKIRIPNSPRRSSANMEAQTENWVHRCAISPSATPCPTPSSRAC